MESNEKIVDSLNELIQINNDRIEGYERASKETNETDLKLLFERFASKSNMFKSQLNSEVVKRGGKPNESTTASGKVFRVWMDFKAALTGKDRKAILSSCEFGEDAAQEVYDDIIKSGIGLP
ncbi:MAG: PA2169 family four-helix-bundle protein, partial [Bacteroidia bacterium]|nr:PA2169 family four-helix-bundle protein [Bacteroidia bacterium]